MIATDLDSFFHQGSLREENVEHTIKIYGRCSIPHVETFGDNLDAVEMSGLAPLRKSHLNIKTLTVKCTKVEFPVSFLRRHNKKGFIRVKLI